MMTIRQLFWKIDCTVWGFVIYDQGKEVYTIDLSDCRDLELLRDIENREVEQIGIDGDFITVSLKELK